jgi:two-component system, LuxR family, sensor kinase FixL
VTAFQLLMLVLATAGLVAGALVTERHRAEFQLRLQQNSLARFARLQSIGELAVAVAHEINQPLMAAGTYSRLVRDELIHKRNDDLSIAEIADKAATQVERASEIVRRLRSLMKLDKSDRTLVTIGRIVSETVDLCQPELSRSGIDFRTILEGNLPLVIVDLLQIEEVLLNLIRNAIEAIYQAGHAGGMITIEAKRVEGGNVELSVRDTGPGFADGQTTAHFPLFATTKPEGIGIGLSLSRRIIEAHGGQLTAENDARGAVVRFTLPVARKHD